MAIRTLIGDCRDVLRTLPAESVHCCVTSPPYWALRDYGVAGQIGLEPTIAEYVAEMVAVFSEVRRVLRPDGTCWVNLGDSYAGSWSGNSMRPDGGNQRLGEPGFQPLTDNRYAKRNGNTSGLKPKDLCGVPWRVAFALQADGWYLRQDIIWAKPNPMPESVTDRCTKSHEYIFLLTKNARYFYDADAIKEPNDAVHMRWLKVKRNGVERGDGDRAIYRNAEHADGNLQAIGRNKRSVWTVATAPFSEAHFATFPPELIEPCIKAGTSEKGCCAKCGAPWARVTERLSNGSVDASPSGGSVKAAVLGGIYAPGRRGPGTTFSNNPNDRVASKKHIGWQPTCACTGRHITPCTVLDPFGGAGTTGLVADRLQRNAILIELNPKYAEMADRRIFDDAPLLQGCT